MTVVIQGVYVVKGTDSDSGDTGCICGEGN